MTNVVILKDFNHRLWNKYSYNNILPPLKNPENNTTHGVVTFKHKPRRNGMAFIYCYTKNITLKQNTKYTCTVWAKTNDPLWKVKLYTGTNHQVKTGRVICDPLIVPGINTWVKLSWTFTNPAKSQVECFSFRFDGNSKSHLYTHSLYKPVITEFKEETTIVNENTNTKSNSDTKTDTLPQNLSDVFSVIYERYIDTVVNIMVTSKDGNTYKGTGFFISSDGYIATAGHVIVAGDTAPEPFVNKVYVTIYPENKLVEADIIGVDRLYDIGLLKVNTSGRDYLEWFNSRNTKIGSYAITIGHPLGHHVQSITSGIVSENKCQDYSWMPESLIVDFSIIGGNSGGPVINKEGKAIGVVSWGYDVSNFSLNGSVSSYVAKKIVDDMILRHKNKENIPMTFKTGYIGVYFRPIGMYETVNMGLNTVQGMQIISVADNSPAKTAGLRSNDVITNANDHILGKFNNQELLGTIIHFTPIGQTVRLVVLRRSKTLNINIPVTLIPPNKDYIFANTHTIQKLMKKELVLHC